MQPRIVDISRVLRGTPPEPVDLATVKLHLRVDFPDDDTYITSLITQCRKSLENYCFISIVASTVTLTIEYTTKSISAPQGPGSVGTVYGLNPNNIWLNVPGFELPYGPLPAGVTSVSYIDFNDVSNPLTAISDYNVRGVDYKKLKIFNITDQNAVIVYNTGYSVVPEDLILALLNEIAFRYENRGDSTNRYASQDVGLSESSQYLASQYKRTAWL